MSFILHRTDEIYLEGFRVFLIHCFDSYLCFFVGVFLINILVLSAFLRSHLFLFCYVLFIRLK